MRFHLDHLPSVRAAVAAADACSTIAEIQEAQRAFDADPHAAANPPMPGGPGARCPETGSVMILGKAPAGTEAETRVPFSGPAGLLLRRMMSMAGLDMEACWITCATAWRARRDNTPNATQLAWSRPFLMREIAIARPSVILCLGQKADEALTQKTAPLGDRIGEEWDLDAHGHRARVVLLNCHAHVLYGEAERLPGYVEQLRRVADAHPEAFAGVRRDVALAA